MRISFFIFFDRNQYEDFQTKRRNILIELAFLQLKHILLCYYLLIEQLMCWFSQTLKNENFIYLKFLRWSFIHSFLQILKEVCVIYSNNNYCNIGRFPCLRKHWIVNQIMLIIIKYYEIGFNTLLLLLFIYFIL